VIDPAFERQSVVAQVGVASPEAWIHQHVLREIGGLVGNHGAIRPCRAVTDASKTLRAGRDLRLEHRRDPVAQPEVGGADDTRRHPRLAVPAARAHRRDALHELRLADHLELFRSVGPVHRRALDEHRLAHIVRPGVSYEILEEVPVARPIPQVVVRVDDWKRWLEGRLVGQRQPVRRPGPGRGRLLGSSSLRHDEAFQGACGDEATDPILPCAIEKTPARDVFHTPYTEWIIWSLDRAGYAINRPPGGAPPMCRRSPFSPAHGSACPAM
jgi:hypothetical protein